MSSEIFNLVACVALLVNGSSIFFHEYVS